MNKMIVFLLTTLSLFGHVINFDIGNVIDLAINHKSSTILAYPSIRNEEILKGHDVSKYGQLRWYSIGHPTLISRNSSFSIANVFEIGPFGFDILIEVLTDTQREMFKEEVKSQYGIDVETSQIQNLIPTELNCSTKVLCSNGTRLNLYGEGTGLTMHKLKVKFDAQIGSEEIECFEHHLIEYNQLKVNCVIRKKTKNVNTFIITWEQMSKSNLLIKLFGNRYGVYVTRHQMAELASEIHQLMNVYREYWFNVREFSLSFINGLIKQKVLDFNPVPIDSAFKMLSKYSMKDSDPNIIKKNLSNVLKVKTVGDKKHIIANSEYTKSNSEEGVFSASASFNYVKEKEQSWANSSKSLDYQLKELNSHSQDNIEWEIEGEKIVPKSLKVSRLLKTSFNGKLKFERIKRIIEYYIDIKFFLEYKKDNLYTRIANTSIETFNSSIVLNSIRTRSLIECIQACEDNQICHYAQLSDKTTCSLYKKTANLFLKVESGNKQRLYERRRIN